MTCALYAFFVAAALTDVSNFSSEAALLHTCAVGTVLGFFLFILPAVFLSKFLCVSGVSSFTYLQTLKKIMPATTFVLANWAFTYNTIILTAVPFTALVWLFYRVSVIRFFIVIAGAQRILCWFGVFVLSAFALFIFSAVYRSWWLSTLASTLNCILGSKCVCAVLLTILQCGVETMFFDVLLFFVVVVPAVFVVYICYNAKLHNWPQRAKQTINLFWTGLINFINKIIKHF